MDLDPKTKCAGEQLRAHDKEFLTVVLSLLFVGFIHSKEKPKDIKGRVVGLV